ncbi:MAG: PAS domain-containing protein [Polyangiaceae bacterium]|nr:PAS domain-containing protein [Polyangiaceae bacterium]
MAESQGGTAGPESVFVNVVLDSLHEGMQVLAPDWRYLYVNEAAASHGRRTPEELLGRTLLECYPGIEQSKVFEVMQRCMEQRAADTVENLFKYEDGTEAWFELRIRPCQEGIVVLSLDVTDRKRLETALRQSHKLRALGEMAVGVAHDLKNLLNPLGLQVELLRRKTKSDARAGEILDQMSGVLKRGTQTIDRLREFARQAPESGVVPVDLNAVTREAVDLCYAKTLKHDKRVRISSQLDGAVMVRANGSELLAAIVNLVFNALDAMPEGGTVTLRTGLTEAGGWVAVEDTGVGMTPEVKLRAFEPFFTTKGEQGTGMGLAMVFAFAARCDGRADLRSSPGEGTTVTLSFPALASAQSVA